MKPPKLLAACDDCWENNPEAGCMYPEEVAWSPKRQQWLCSDCWQELQEYDEAREDYVDEVPLVRAKDALPDQDEQLQRLIVAATKRRLEGK